MLRHVALVAKFLDDDENVTSTCFKLHRSYSVSFNLSNVGEIFWGRIRKDHIKIKGKKKNKNGKSEDYSKADLKQRVLFFITIFRLAIQAFFRFTDVTELM